jgi:hypothetical protein
MLTRKTRVWVGQTDPAHSASLTPPLSSSRALSCDQCHRRHLQILAISGDFRRWHLGKQCTPLPSSSSTKWIWKSTPLRWDLGSISARVFAGSCRLWAHTPPDLLPVLAVRVCGGQGVCASPVEAPSAVLPVVLRWRLPQVAPGRPRGHCPAMPSRHAPGCLVSLLLSFSSPLLSSPATVTGRLAMTSMPSSQTFFCDAAFWCKLAVLDPVKYSCAWSCDDLLCLSFSVRVFSWQRC